MNTTINITIRDHNISRKDLALWLRSIMRYPRAMSMSALIEKADLLLQGETLSPNYFNIRVDEIGDASPCLVVIDTPPNPHIEAYNEQMSYYQLMLKGADGDTEAAVTYCQLEKARKVTHGAMAC
jgi:hypothetical protein